MSANYEQHSATTEEANRIYTFPKGMPGFEHLREFRLQQHNELFSLLSAVEEPAITFITVDPFDFISDYEFILSDETMQDLQVDNREQVIVRCIVTWHSDRKKTTINLLAPLIFNTENQSGKQIVLQNTGYNTKHRLWPDHSEGGDS
ncbi:Flagellar assembly factor FliW [compost metagenome]